MSTTDSKTGHWCFILYVFDLYVPTCNLISFYELAESAKVVPGGVRDELVLPTVLVLPRDDSGIHKSNLRKNKI